MPMPMPNAKIQVKIFFGMPAINLLRGKCGKAKSNPSTHRKPHTNVME